MPRSTRLPGTAARRGLTLAAVAALSLPLLGTLSAQAADAPPVFTGPRGDSPLVLTGAQLPSWSRPAAVGTNPSPTSVGSFDGVRSAHNGVVIVPPDPDGTNAAVDDIAAWRWNGQAWQEVRVQVDERFPNFLANAHSTFGVYSGTDQELTYAWGPSAHAKGEEAWKKIFGGCFARYAAPSQLDEDIAEATANGSYSPAPGETPADYTRAMADPAVGLDDDDEIALHAGDAGPQAPASQPQPFGTKAGSGQTVSVVDPTDPSRVGYLYLFQKDGGSRFTAADGYVQMDRNSNADQWISKASFGDGDPEALGISNTNYGPNLAGSTCDGGVLRESKDRFPRDGMTVTTDRYKVEASGRWMVRSYAVRMLDGSAYGPDLIDRWKGRAFQQSPDSSVSLVGFEDEQVNWEANAGLLGWRQGPVRAIREVWGADSGTNVTKTETYYRDADTYRYRVRVHPIPSDGLYTSWDYNKGVVARYYNTLKPQGVAIDGLNDDTGSIDRLPVSGDPAFLDAPDPTFDAVTAVDRPEQVAGRDGAGSVVYVFEFKGATSAANASAVPYYRDDACLDDGTGDDPIRRPWPGEAHSDQRFQAGEVAYWKAHGAPASLTYEDLKCNPGNSGGLSAEAYAALPEWQETPFQGAYGSHGIHFAITGDSDNAQLPAAVNEIDGQQWRYAVPMDQPENVIDTDGPNWSNNVLAPLQTVATPYLTSTVEAGPSASPTPTGSTSPSPSTAGSPSPSGTGSPSPTGTGSPSPTGTPTRTPTGSPSASPTGSTSPSPTGSTSPSPTKTPSGSTSPTPTGSGSPSPTGAPSGSASPTASPGASGGSPAPAGDFHPLTPMRLLDTRDADSQGIVRAGNDRTVQVLGKAGVPTSGVKAVVLNATVTGVDQGMDLQLYPADSGRPTPRTSNVNARRGGTAANMVTVPVGEAGLGMSVSRGATHVVLDVLGWYDDGSQSSDRTAGDGYVPQTPQRVFDSRDTTRVQAGSDRVVQLLPPGSAGRAAVVTVTGLGTPGNADVQLYPTGSRPDRRTSTLNLHRGQTVANLDVVPVDAQGRVSISVSQDSAQVVLDLLGTFTPDSTRTYTPVVPKRTLDTRDSKQPVQAGKDRDVRVLGTGGVPDTGVSAVLVNVTSARSTRAADLQVYPSGDKPSLRTSSLNVQPGQDVGSLVLAKVGADGKIALSTSQGEMDVVFDVLGWVSAG